MSLPKQLNNQSGQVLVIFLLVLVIGLALVLSIASRTVTDIRQTTTSDESNRAYYAAESGVEDALKKISAGTVPGTYTVDLSSVNNSTSNVSVAPFPAPGNAGQIVDLLSYQKDDVAQINLMSNFDNLGTAGVGTSVLWNHSLTFYYGAFGTAATSSSAPAIEVSFVTRTVAGVWGLKKMVFDPNSGRGNNFCKPGANPPGGSTYAFSVQVPLNNPPCVGNNEAMVSSDNLVLARVRFLYGNSPLGIARVGSDLPQQGHLINSTGSTPSGVSRKLVNKRLYPTLPALFDYVLYNGSAQDLCKGSSC